MLISEKNASVVILEIFWGITGFGGYLVGFYELLHWNSAADSMHCKWLQHVLAKGLVVSSCVIDQKTSKPYIKRDRGSLNFSLNTPE